MSEDRGCACDIGDHEARVSLHSTAADWLSLAATPSFAAMAMLTAFHGGGPMNLYCSAVHDASPLGGMAPMYMLMSAFHCVPWIRRAPTRRTSERQQPRPTRY
ncbi:MAG TPA: hypothetical protein VNT42_08960 [Sphingomonas sp.]|nr:hypothetical protein [Sphingomonas sp.]